MTGEMNRSDVTAQNYPDLFKLMDLLENEGVNCKAEPFDHYRGPYLACETKDGNFKVWHPPPEEVVMKGKTKDGFRIEKREYIEKPPGTFFVDAQGGAKTFEIDNFDIGRLLKKLNK